MSRVKRGFKARRRRKKILKLAKGYIGGRRKLFRTATETVDRALCYAYRDRKNKKRDLRKLWIIRINAAVHEHGLNYNNFIHKLNKLNILLNRKILSEMAINNPKDFYNLIQLINTN